MDRDARIADAPALIVLCGVVWSQSRRRFLRGEVGMAGMQMMLQAHALGLGTCWVDGLEREAIADELGIPSELEIIGVMTLGFPDTEPAQTTRKALFDIVHYDVWEGVDFGGMADVEDATKEL
jgi:nitroreductase